MKNLIVVLLIAFIAPTLSAQSKYFTKEGKISFSSDAPMEKIEAHNRKANSVLDPASGKMEWSVLVKAFQFDKALMQEHFNENYMESDKFPKAVFKGVVQQHDKIDWTKDGAHNVKVKGTLEIHGVTKDVVADGKITIKGGSISAQSDLTIAVSDYEIKIPAVVKDNIAKTVKIDIKADYAPLVK
ncbi:MAG: YceI family protein [Saprospiraceae bacterium]|jgi:hypothetical protein|nr:YceI family protein [Saprospiraceae bacterium]